ncbi:hypothetical protein diail_11895 [Diaporthe ilicicola]|nr:hypothetical protein diail_11895 [Diaporthe ilicicola]
MGFSSLKSNNPFRHKSNDDVDDVPPPAGPPPSYAGAGSGSGPGQGDYAPPPGPPPSYGHQQSSGDYAAPPGPPPSQQQHKTDDYGPPPGPPPSQAQQPQQHNWQEAVPDTSGFPPPPDIFSGWDRSQASNASEDQAEEGESWCRRYPLSAPLNLDREPGLRRPGIVPRLIAPPAGVFSGGSLTQSQSASGSWTLKSSRRGGDCCIVGYPHAYLVQRDSPLATGRAATVYFECYVREMASGAGFALGFTALPYPPFRMPGWHRGSLAVHGDDGHRFVNDRWGGKDFTRPFKAGEVVGIGMTFSPGAGASSSDGKGAKGSGGPSGGTILETEVFFTRNGKLDGRWNLHESLDAETDLPVTGLEGYHDLAVAVGTFGQVGAEVVLDPTGWRYKPY